MATFNEKLADKFVYRAVNLEKFKASERFRVGRLLKGLENRMVTELVGADLTTYQVRRFGQLLAQVRGVIRDVYDKIDRTTEAQAVRLADLETAYAGGKMNALFGAEMVDVGFSAEQLQAVVGDALIDGAPTSEWWSRQALKAEQKFADVVRRGLLSGETTPEIASRVRSEVGDGTRRGAEALVRSSIQAVSTESRKLLFEENRDVIDAVQQRSVLDARTTDICKAYSGMTWSLPDYEPLDGALPFNGGPPRHWNCRSHLIPVVKSLAAMAGLKKEPEFDDEEFQARLRKQGFTQEQAEAAVAQGQAALDGVAPEDMDYEAWLRTKSDQFQQDVLGPTKYNLWKAGKLSFTDLVDESGDPLTIEELKKRVA